MDNDSSFRIVAALREWIAGSVPGARLPTSRALVAEYGASPVTVQKALRTLVAQGLIETRPGAGTFVRAVRTARPLDYSWQTAAMRSPHSHLSGLSPALRAAPQGAIALHAGYPDRELLPERLIRSALARAARGDAALTRSPVAGLPELQSWFAHELGAATPVGVTPPLPSDVIVLPGSQSGLATIFRALVTAGRPLLMESPTYWGAIQAAAQAGVEVIPIPTGQDGPDPDALARAFQESGSRVFYAQPTYANPTGARWSDAATTQILDVVRAHGAFLVEDDWAHDFGIDTDPRPVAAR
ncbi:DNA-binding transcriptional MocR family regulator, partial [Cryobacterium sp. MP_M5]|uniref:aminotransferase-like domain-containing protein n=1 Tax=unclassified Cryobacterium TaxID=2649013 RepID=UPI0018CA58BC